MATKSLDERLKDLYNRRDYVGQQFNSADIKTFVEGIRDAREKSSTPIKGATATELQPDETPTAEMTSDGTLVLGIPKGQKGDDGKQGDPGEQGKSAYQVWLEEGNEGTEADFFNSLKAHVSRFIPIATEAGATSLEVGDTYAFSNVSNPTDGAMLLMPNGDTTTPKTLMFSVTSNGDTPETFTYTYVGELSISTEGFLSSDKIVQDLTTGGADKVPSAAAVKALNEQLYGAYDDSLESDAQPRTNVKDSSTGNRAIAGFRNDYPDSSWYVGGSARSGYVELDNILAQGYKKLAVTMSDSNGLDGFITFVKKHLPTNRSLSYDELVSEGYICNIGENAHPDASRVARRCYANETRTFVIPEGAKYAYFVYYITSSDGNDTYIRRPSAVKGCSLLVNGDVQNLRDATAENKFSLREKVIPSNLQGGYINAADGSIEQLNDNVNAQIGTFVNIDVSKTYYASGKKSSSTLYAAICYYDETDTLLGTDNTMDAGVFTNHQLTLPTGTVKIKVQGHKDDQPAVLYVGEGVVDAGVAADTTEKLKENSLVLLAPTRVYGNSTLKDDGFWMGASDNAYVNEYNVVAGNVYLLSGHVVKQTSSTVFVTGLWLDSNDNIIGLPICPSITESAQMTVDKSVVAPYGAVKLRVSGHKADDPNHQRAYLKTFVANAIKDNYWYGKKCVWTGDSLSWGSGLYNSSDPNDYGYLDAWPYKVCQALGMDVKNYAVGGSILAKGKYLELDYTETYEGVFSSVTAFNNAEKDITKHYLVKDNYNTDDNNYYRVYHYFNGEWGPIIGSQKIYIDVFDSYSAFSAANNKLTSKKYLVKDNYKPERPYRIYYYDSGWKPYIQAINYDDVFFSVADFDNAEKDQNKKYLVKDGPNTYNPRPWSIRYYEDGVWKIYKTVTTSYPNSVNCGRTPIVDRIYEMDTDADLVVVCIGTNDFYYMWSDFGTMSSRDKTSFYGALHIVCKYLLETYENKQIVFANCIKRWQMDGQTRGTWDIAFPLTVSPAGHTLEDYNTAIKEVCAYYSIPVVDMYTLSGLNPAVNPEMFADTTGMHTHPNKAGHIRMAEVMKAFLLGLKKGVEIVG